MDRNRVSICLMLLWCLYSTSMGVVRFVVTSDTHVYPGGTTIGTDGTILSEIVAATIDEGVDFILVSGDLTQGFTSRIGYEQELVDWREIMSPVYDAGIGVYPVRGNHDAGSTDSKIAWDNVFTGQYALPGNGPAGEENITFSFTTRMCLWWVWIST